MRGLTRASRLTGLVGWLLAGAIGLPTLIAPPENLLAATPQQVSQSIQDLASPDPVARKTASETLWAAGKAAESALAEAADSEDPQLSAAAREILLDLQSGIRPDADRDVLNQVRTYRTGVDRDRRAAVVTLAQSGPAAHRVLMRLMQSEGDEEMRAYVLRQLTLRGATSPGMLIRMRDFRSAETLLENLAADGSEEAIRAYVIYLTSRGRVEEKLAGVARTPDAFHPALPAYLYLARGDLGAAVEAARKGADTALVEQLLLSAGRWGDLADRLQARFGGGSSPAQIGLLAACRQRAGQAAEADKLLEKLRQAEPAAEPERLAAPEVLLLNDRIEEGIALLAGSDRVLLAVELLSHRDELDRALALADQAIQAGRGNVAELRAWRGLLLARMGESGLARQAFDELARGLDADPGPERWAILIRGESRAHLVDRAAAHCAQAIAKTRRPEEAEPLVYALFAGTETEAAADALSWWGVLRSIRADEPAADTIMRLRKIMERRIAGREMEELGEQIRQVSTGLAGEPRTRLLLAAGRLWLDLGQVERGGRYLEEASRGALSLDVGFELAELAVNARRWDLAADIHERVMQAQPNRVVPRYLRGLALARSGQVRPGRSLMDEAAMSLLADDRERLQLAMALQRLGEYAPAREFAEMVTRLGQPATWRAHPIPWRLAAEEAARAGDHAAAAGLYDRAALVLCQETMRSPHPAWILRLRYDAHLERARALLAAGKGDEARSGIEACIATLPGHVNTAIELHALLRQAGRSPDADALVARIRAFHAAILEKHPQCVPAHNAIAWLLARCRTDLDAALLHAQQAAALEPENCAILDTLAEVRFQRYEKPQAVAAIRRCIELQPHVQRHQQALKRFIESTPDMPPPPE